MEILFIAGLLLYGVPLLYMGIRNFGKVDKLTEEAHVKGIPAPRVAVIGSTIWLMVGVLAFIANFMVLVGGIMIAFYLVITGVKIHNFWTVTNPEVRERELIQLEKNIIMAGAALAIAAAS